MLIRPRIAHTFHLESNPGNARALVQAMANDVWLNPPPFR